MDVHSRIHYNGDELVQSTENVLEELKYFQYNARYQVLLGDELINQMKLWDKNIRARKKDPFTLVVCGEFKRGKSSLINAILKEEVVTVNVTTETVTLNRISYGDHLNEAILQGGRRMTLTDEELKKENLEEIIRQTSEPITRLELHRSLDLLGRITIIDTPGLNDASFDFSAAVEDALRQADAVIYVCSVGSPLSLTEQMFLRTMILPQKYTDLFLLANYSDTITAEDAARMEQFMNQKIETLMPDQKFLMVSALDELCRAGGHKRPNPQMQEYLEANFDRFRNKLDEMIEMKKDIYLPNRIHRLARGMEADLNRLLDAIEAGLDMDIRQAEEYVANYEDNTGRQQGERAKLEESLRSDIMQMKEQCRAWIGEMLDQMSNEANTLGDIPAEDLKKFYSTYCVDTIQSAFDRCVDFHVEQIYDRLDQVCTDASMNVSALKGKTNYGFRFALDNKTWTKGDNVSYVVSQIPMIGLLDYVANGIAGSMRLKAIAKQAPDILRAIIEQYPNFRKSAEDAIDSIYNKLSDNVHTQLTEYFESQNEKDRLQNEQILRTAQQTKENKEEVRAAVKQMREILSELSGES